MLLSLSWKQNWKRLLAKEMILPNRSREKRRMVAERRLTRSNVSEILREANGMPKRN